jgi:hypothetical protein
MRTLKEITEGVVVMADYKMTKSGKKYKAHKATINPQKQMGEESNPYDEIVEGFDQVDEVSKSTMANYISKAAKDAAYDANLVGFKAGQKTKGHNPTAESPKETKRHKGIARALRKLTGVTVKEEEMQDNQMTSEEADQIDEVSQETIKSYRSKASKSSQSALNKMHFTPRMPAEKYKEVEAQASKEFQKRSKGIKRADARLGTWKSKPEPTRDYSKEETPPNVMTDKQKRLRAGLEKIKQGLSPELKKIRGIDEADQTKAVPANKPKKKEIPQGNDLPPAREKERPSDPGSKISDIVLKAINVFTGKKMDEQVADLATFELHEISKKTAAKYAEKKTERESKSDRLPSEKTISSLRRAYKRMGASERGMNEEYLEEGHSIEKIVSNADGTKTVVVRGPTGKKMSHTFRHAKSINKLLYRRYGIQNAIPGGE